MGGSAGVDRAFGIVLFVVAAASAPLGLLTGCC
jgi:hypothetical protein